VAWVGDLTEIPTDEGKLQLASIIPIKTRAFQPGEDAVSDNDTRRPRRACLLALKPETRSNAGVVL
jgi:putative transposase